MFKGRRGPLVAGAIFVALVILLIFFLVLPKMSQVSSAREDLAAAEAETSTLESQLAALEQAEAQRPRVQGHHPGGRGTDPADVGPVGLPAADQERRGAVVGRV